MSDLARCPACNRMYYERGVATHWLAKTRSLRWEDDRYWPFNAHWLAWGAAEGIARFLEKST